MCFDLAPHVGMYHDFSREPEAARAFFLRYPERILYGTDMDTRVLERGPEGHAFMRSIPWLIRSMLETAGEFTLGDGDFSRPGLAPTGVRADIPRKFRANISGWTRMNADGRGIFFIKNLSVHPTLVRVLDYGE